jgi:hypothetical protein
VTLHAEILGLPQSKALCFQDLFLLSAEKVGKDLTQQKLAYPYEKNNSEQPSND